MSQAASEEQERLREEAADLGEDAGYYAILD